MHVTSIKNGFSTCSKPLNGSTHRVFRTENKSAVLQEEGLATAALFAADLVVKNILDVFALLKTPEQIMATLRQ